MTLFYSASSYTFMANSAMFGAAYPMYAIGLVGAGRRP
jgi:hypothetical protein